VSAKKPGFEFVENPYGVKNAKPRKGLLLRGPWRNEFVHLVEHENVTALYLNTARGWIGDDCSFLGDLRNLEEINIVSGKISGLEAIEDLPHLEEISINGATDSKINFSRLTGLQKCFLHWWPGAQDVFRCESLRSLSLNSVKSFPLNWAGRLEHLVSLSIANSNLTELSELVSLKRLERLELVNCKKIENFLPIASLRDLTWLDITGTKLLRTLDGLVDLTSLQVLLLVDDGSIASLRPLVNLKSLRALSFVGTTSIEDGELGVLGELPCLSILGFAPRQHYTHVLKKPWSWSNFDTPDNLLLPRS
jgi:hypothetical protein